MTTVADGQTGVAVKEMTFAAALNEALDEALARDPKVFVLGEDISDRTGGPFKVTQGLTDKYGPERVRDTPIAEQAIIGAGIGAALAGMRPVAEIMMMDFMAVAMDQIVNHAGKLRYMSGGRTSVPLTIRTAVGGGLGFGAQHSQSLEAWFAHSPGLKVVIPTTPADAKGLLTACIEDDDPCIFMESMALMYAAKGPVPVGRHTVPLGKAAVRREGTDLTVVSYGKMVPVALDAAEEVSGSGVSVEVVDLRSLVPLDLPTVFESVGKTKRAVVVHAATKAFGVGAEIAARIHEELFGELEAPVARLGARHAPNPYAPDLEAALYPSKAELVAQIKASVR